MASNDRLSILIQTLLEAPSQENINKVKSQIQNSIGKVTTNTGSNGIKLLDDKEIDTYTQKMQNAIARLQIGKDKVFANNDVQGELYKLQNMLGGLGTTSAVSTKEIGLQFDNLKTKVAQVSSEFRNVNKDGYSFTQMIELAAKKIAIWGISTGIVYGSLRELKSGINFINELNKSMTNIQMITQDSHESIVQYTKDFSDLASTLHDSTLSVMNAAEQFLRAGNDINSTTELVKASTVMSKIANQSQSESAESLIAIMNSYKMSASEMMNTVSKMVILDNTSATSVAELSAALKDTSQSAQLAGSSFNNLLSYIGTVSSVSRKSAKQKLAS